MFGVGNRVAFNEIDRVCRESSDCGALYMGRSWLMRGNEIRHNYFHDIVGVDGKWCRTVYLDDMMSGAHVYGNVFERTPWGVFISGGRDNLVENNLFLDCPKAIHLDRRGTSGCFREYIDRWAGEMRERRTLTGVMVFDPPWSVRFPEVARIVVEGNLYVPLSNAVVRNAFLRGKGETIRRLTNREPAEGWWFDGPEETLKSADGNVVRDNVVDPVDPLARPAGFREIPFAQIGVRKRR